MVKGRLSTGGGEYGWGARWPGPVSLLTTASFTRDGSPSRVRKPALWEHMPAYAPPKNLDASQDESSVAFGNRGSGVKESVTAFPHAE